MSLEKINEFRKKQGLSIEELATISGVPKSTLAKIAAGITANPNIDTVKAIARALHCSLDDFDDQVKQSTIRTLESGTRWQELQSNFEKLNEAGQDRLVEFSEMLLSKNEYKAGGESPSSSSGETVRVFMAARSTDNTPPEWVNMPKEEVERIFNAPESDLDI